MPRGHPSVSSVVILILMSVTSYSHPVLPFYGAHLWICDLEVGRVRCMNGLLNGAEAHADHIGNFNLKDQLHALIWRGVPREQSKFKRAGKSLAKIRGHRRTKSARYRRKIFLRRTYLEYWPNQVVPARALAFVIYIVLYICLSWLSLFWDYVAGFCGLVHLECLLLSYKLIFLYLCRLSIDKEILAC